MNIALAHNAQQCHTAHPLKLEHLLLFGWLVLFDSFQLYFNFKISFVTDVSADVQRGSDYPLYNIKYESIYWTKWTNWLSRP